MSKCINCGFETDNQTCYDEELLDEAEEAIKDLNDAFGLKK